MESRPDFHVIIPAHSLDQIWLGRLNVLVVRGKKYPVLSVGQAPLLVQLINKGRWMDVNCKVPTFNVK